LLNLGSIRATCTKAVSYHLIELVMLILHQCVYIIVMLISALQNSVWLLWHIFWSVNMFIVTSRLSVAE